MIEGIILGLALKLIPGFSYEHFKGLYTKIRDKVQEHKKDEYKAKYDSGMRYISDNRQEITNFLYRYYNLNYASVDDVCKIGYVGLGNDLRKLPLITKKDYIFNTYSQFTINSSFSDEKPYKPSLTQDEFIEIMGKWEAAKLNIWDDPIYTIYNINESTMIELEYRLTRFFTYRSSIGSISDEFAEVIPFNNHEHIFENREYHLPKRNKYLSSIDSIFNF